MIKRLLRRKRSDGYRYLAPDFMDVADRDKTLARLRAKRAALAEAINSTPADADLIEVGNEQLRRQTAMRRLHDVDVMIRSVTGHSG